MHVQLGIRQNLFVLFPQHFFETVQEDFQLNKKYYQKLHTNTWSSDITLIERKKKLSDKTLLLWYMKPRRKKKSVSLHQLFYWISD
jgi:hypothetical protein